jgi:hypothetical protein
MEAPTLVYAARSKANAASIDGKNGSFAIRRMKRFYYRTLPYCVKEGFRCGYE